jgi:hypothetical protein
MDDMRAVLLTTIAEHKRAETEKATLQERVDQLTEACTQAERHARSTTMQVRFLKAGLAHLKANGSAAEELVELKAVIVKMEELNARADMTPAVLKKLREHGQFETELAELRTSYPVQADSDVLAEYRRKLVRFETVIQKLLTETRGAVTNGKSFPCPMPAESDVIVGSRLNFMFYRCYLGDCNTHRAHAWPVRCITTRTLQRAGRAGKIQAQGGVATED